MVTEPSTGTGPIHVVRPMIMEVRASIVSDVEAHVHWSVGYAPEAAADGSRFILMHLHAAGDDGFVEVEIAASQIGGGFSDIKESETANFEAGLAAAESLGVIYDLARITAKSLSGTIESDIGLPLTPPAAQFTRLVLASDGDSTEL